MANPNAQRRAATLCKSALPYLLVEDPGGDEDAPIHREVAPGLWCAYRVDRGDHYELLQERHLATAGMSADDLHAASVRGLIDRVNEQLEMQALGDGAHGLILDGELESSLLVLDPLWEHSLRSYVTGDVVAAIPARDVLAFASDTPAGIAQLQAIVGRVPAGDRLSGHLFRRSDGAWTPY